MKYKVGDLVTVKLLTGSNLIMYIIISTDFDKRGIYYHTIATNSNDVKSELHYIKWLRAESLSLISE